ncbi:Zn-ribbon domain-containing OB-fold protein [Natronorubrum halophilum]|uniref:Zn-ribbon domain-containing OB-fold protein n=1 Tax=Natronorubrum halophilum TaxID=1702106 RepID=UPI0010C1854C|nr:OB-fold domain-containing protein [Natronorubrum halophilum]
MTAAEHQDDGFDAFLGELRDGQGYYYGCSNDHSLLPPRRACSHCGDRDLQRKPLPEVGTIVTHTTVFVPTAEFEDDAPYVTAIAEFGPVRLTGIIRGTDRSGIEIGQSVAVSVELDETGTERKITFRPT